MKTQIALPELSPSVLAERYEGCLGAVDAEGAVPVAALRFAAWLADHWQYRAAPEPRSVPDAVSSDRRGVAMIRWYATSRGIAGWVPGVQGHYFVPATDHVPRE